jgi:hypothetical protein
MSEPRTVEEYRAELERMRVVWQECGWIEPAARRYERLQRELAKLEADRPEDLTEEDHDRFFGPPDLYQPDPFGAAAAGWDELDCGGIYDGFQVVSDADPGL